MNPVLGTRLNLPTCYGHVGKLASAALGYAHLFLSLMRLALFEKNV